MRRERGTGGVKWRADKGRWQAVVTLIDGTRRTRMTPTRDAAVDALSALIAEHEDQLGYFYRMPRPYYFGTRPKPTRQGITAALRFRVLERDGFRCVYCRATTAEDRLVLDHVLPVAAGGTDAEDNLATACETCNRGKAARILSLVGVA